MSSTQFKGQFVHDSPLPKYQKLMADRKYGEALDLMRKEVANPGIVGNDDYLVNVYMLSIKAAADFGKQNRTAVTPELDAEVRRYVDAAAALAPKDVKLRTFPVHFTVIYFMWTGRPGLALPYALEEAHIWEATGNKLQAIVAYHAVVTALSDAGKRDQAEQFEAKTLALASEYFKGPGQPTSASDWTIYLDVLASYMGHAAQPGGLSRLEGLWAKMEPILLRSVTPTATYYWDAAAQFALAGAVPRSKELWKKGSIRGLPKDPARARDIVACPKAKLTTHQKAYAEAKIAWEQCLEVASRLNMPADAGIYRLRGTTFEGLGDLDAALEQYRLHNGMVEQARSSYTVADRGAIFRTEAADGYYGMIRVLAKKAERATDDEASVFEALRAAEDVRARQFGDLLNETGRGGGRVVPLKSLSQLREQLSAKDAVLDFVVHANEITAFAITKDKAIARTIPVDDAFPLTVRALAKALANPASSARTDQAFADLGDKVLAPLQSAISGKTRYYVLPDGVLNLVPFELMRVSGRRVIDTTTVVNAPSLAYLASSASVSQAPKGFYSVGDPKYPRELRVGTRVIEAKDFKGTLPDPIIPPLPETRSEVKAISKLFLGEPLETLYGEAASKSAVKGASLVGYRFLHFATHGLLANQIPTLDEPALVLADAPNEDAFLTATEAEKLKLNAELTVLSACNTGSGEYVSGEGVLGMSRAFLLAGSRSVLVSLWSVDSAATELLMVEFYKRLRQGADAPTALRAAKLAIRSSKPRGEGERGLQLETKVKETATRSGTMDAPFFWSAFILVGR